MNVTEVLKKLGYKDTGHYDNQSYILDLENSDDYARAYTVLDKNTVNTDNPVIETNTNNTTTKITSYFEFEESDGEIDNIFLVADFVNDKYYIRIKQQ